MKNLSLNLHPDNLWNLSELIEMLASHMASLGFSPLNPLPTEADLHDSDYGYAPYRRGYGDSAFRIEFCKGNQQIWLSCNSERPSRSDVITLTTYTSEKVRYGKSDEKKIRIKSEHGERKMISIQKRHPEHQYDAWCALFTSKAVEGFIGRVKQLVKHCEAREAQATAREDATKAHANFEEVLKSSMAIFRDKYDGKGFNLARERIYRELTATAEKLVSSNIEF